MSKLLITGGRVIDPSQQFDRETSVLIEAGRIAGYDVAATSEMATLDAAGKIVMPGLVDLNTQLREPGFEDDETILTGTQAALAGGFTSIACIPETDPPIDSQAGVEFIRQKAARAKNCHVYVLACVSKNREGSELAEMGSLVEAGAAGFTDAMKPIWNSELLRRALEYALMFDKVILNHPEVPELSRGGLMHEGSTALVLGLAGMPSDAEDVMTSRDIRLCESTGGRMHLINVSCSITIEQLRRAKQRHVRITAGISPWNFAYTEVEMRSFDASWKLNPPLRGEGHLRACLDGLQDGTIDVISSGHSPRAVEKKMQELDQAPFGMASLQTTLAMVITHLVRPGHLSWSAAIEKLTINPARILGIPKGTLAVGADADVTIVDPHAAWKVERSNFVKSSNTPLLGKELFGRVTNVVVGGELRSFA
jgi:dihydroorotase